MKMIYWISTMLISGFLIFSSYSYFFIKSNIEGIRDLGFPDFFRVELGILKILAVIVILLPGIPMVAKEWAYAGVAFFLITAMAAHIAHRDSLWLLVLLIILMGILFASHYSMHKLG